MTDGSPDWFEDERFWSETFSINFTADRFAAAESEVAGLLPRTGRGCHADAWTSPVDRDATSWLAAALVLADVGTFSAPGRYDLVMHLSNSFGCFPTDGNAAVLQNCFASLAPDGRLGPSTAGPTAGVPAAWSGSLERPPRRSGSRRF